MTTDRDPKPRRGRYAKRHNRRSGSNVSGAALSIRSTRDDLLSDQDGCGTGAPLVTALPPANPWRDDEIPATASFEGNGHAGQQAGSRAIPRTFGTAEAAAPRQSAGSR